MKNEVNLPKGRLNHMFSVSVCVCFLQSHALLQGIRAKEQTKIQSCIHPCERIPEAFSALNDWLCKSDCMNKSEAKCFWPALPQPLCLHCQTKWQQRRERLISGMLQPFCATWIVCLCKITRREGWARMFLSSTAPCCFKFSRHSERQSHLQAREAREPITI